jgi:hypothetical protein
MVRFRNVIIGLLRRVEYNVSETVNGTTLGAFLMFSLSDSINN